MRRLHIHMVVLGGLFGLLVGCGEVRTVDATGTISGVVAAPTGGDVMGTRVVACYQTEPDCATFETRVTRSGSSAPYRISGLPSGFYSVYALKDVDGDGSAIGNGDYHGMYDPDPRAVSQVSPPAAGVDIEMRALTDATRSGTDTPLAVQASVSTP